MGSVISALAFPAPQCNKDFYDEVLSSRNDFIYLTTSRQEKIPALFIKGRTRRRSSIFHRSSSNDNNNDFTILYSHGNAEDIGLHIPFVDAMARYTGCNVLSYEYVGYSLSRIEEGADPSEDGCLRSIDAAWVYLTEELNINPRNIILYGRSIGTGPTVDLASRTTASSAPPSTTTGAAGGGGDILSFLQQEKEEFTLSPFDVAGIVLQSPLESGGKVLFGSDSFLVTTVLSSLDIFTNYKKIQKISSSVAIMHGTHDEVVPCANGKNLYEKLQNPFNPPYWIRGKGHNDITDQEVFRYLNTFIQSL